MINFISPTVLSILFLCGVHLTSGIQTNTLSASGLTVYAIASDMVYQQQVNYSSWGYQLGDNSQYSTSVTVWPITTQQGRMRT